MTKYAYLIEYAYYHGAEMCFRLRDLPAAYERLGYEPYDTGLWLVTEDGTRHEISTCDVTLPIKSRGEVNAAMIEQAQKNIASVDERRAKGEAILDGHWEIEVDHSREWAFTGQVPDYILDLSIRAHGWKWLTPEELDAKEAEILRQTKH